MTSQRETQNEQTERIPTAAQRAAWDRIFDILLRPIEPSTAPDEQPQQSDGDEAPDGAERDGD